MTISRLLYRGGLLLMPLGGCAPEATPAQTSTPTAVENYGECMRFASQLDGSAEDIARTQARKGDTRLVSIYGYTVIAPLPGGFEAESALTRKLGTRAIDGTSDAILGDGCARFNRDARNYAARYNVEILKLTGHSD